MDAGDDPQSARATDDVPSVIESASDPTRMPLDEQQLLAKRRLIKAVIELMLQWAPDQWELHRVANHLTAAPVDLRDPDMALQLARRAVELAPENKACRQSLDWALFRTGDWKGTVERIDETIFPEGLFILAMAQWQLGDKDRARACFARGCEWLKGFEQKVAAGRKANGPNWVMRPSPEMERRLQAEAATMLGITAPVVEQAPEAAPKSEIPPK